MLVRDNVKVKSFILDDKEADFLGTWTPKDPHFGAFSMYVTEKKANDEKGFDVKGYIWDCIGFANFDGKVDHSKFEFTKVYDGAAVAKGGFNGEIQYSVKTEDEPGKLTGKYTEPGTFSYSAPTWVKFQKFNLNNPSNN